MQPTVVSIMKSPRSKFLLAAILLFAVLLPSLGFSLAHVQAFSPNVVQGHKEKTLTSPPPQGGFFGYSVASSGKYIAIGAFDKQQGYVFIFTSGGKLLYNITNADVGEFGFSVAMSGSLLLVGAPETTVGGDGSAGAAYLYNVTTGAFLENFTSPNSRGDGEFGNAVAITGNTIVVGAWDEAIGENFDAGNAYIFNVQNPRVATVLSNPDPSDVSAFGFSVGISANRVIVGAVLASYDGQTAAGAAFLYTTKGSLVKEFKSPNPETGGYLGWSVAIGGGLVEVGAIGQTVEGMQAGLVYVFAYNGTLVMTLQSPNPTQLGYFGSALAASGGNIVVGAAYDTIGGVKAAGAAYEFNATGGLIASFKSANAQSEGGFGTSVAKNGGLILVGAPDETVNGTYNAGHAYIVA